MASLLNIGVTGLNAAQAGLVTTGHNISNAATPGFTRQSVVLGTQQPVFSGGGFFGQGTQVETVRRSYSAFLEGQVLSADTQRSQLSAYSEAIAQIDNLLADPEAGLSPALQSFFDGVQEVAANPSSIPARQSMISSANSLVSTFQYLDGRLSDIRDGVEAQIASTATEITAYAKEIADINHRIAVTESAGTSQQANDLRDQRDTLIRDLNQYTRVTTVTESDGSISVFMGSGQPLVIGTTASTLVAQSSKADPGRLEIALKTPGGGSVTMPESLLDGGRLGGLLAFRSGSLDSAQNQLGLIAAGVALTFNAQHRLGQGLDGALGGSFFGELSPSVLGIDGASSNVTVAYGDPAGLTGDDYLLTITGASSFTLTRRSDGSAVNAADVGLDITLGASVTPGERFLIQPTRRAAQDISVAIVDTRQVAVADPVQVAASNSNAGTAKISAVATTDVSGMDAVGVPDGKPDFSDIVLTYDASVPGFNISGAATVGPLAFDPATDSAGKDFTITGPGGFSFSFRLAGTPQAGDSFTFSTNDGGVSDNRNGVALGALQLDKTMLDGKASYQSVYSQLVTTVGTKAREVQIGEKAQTSLLEQATIARDSVSAVNLDEEAANLVRYQQAYQASAKVMSIANTLFDEILAISR